MLLLLLACGPTSPAPPDDAPHGCAGQNLVAQIEIEDEGLVEEALETTFPDLDCRVRFGEATCDHPDQTCSWEPTEADRDALEAVLLDFDANVEATIFDCACRVY